mmetsp:Transcript_19159/g.23705  ORF Transcript_19159/g.23705 Transcript_19159/m.23705 type:complete len:110 (+) Transcript_19159:592-921(+)|eukprot:CAMPEP_0170453490 /NCGR_PEP_ID=MMETSP0123-20130129/2056_1 /TAXON_ID=182087 /ORGANISM="Favella ehrenbergii, Strain Fehren 1" /LENGTH=109 /DNA_ID=CAMNT_0010715883 /DNA_START=854 /DNA_END=1183 /DNA_ORIENTATION=+
MNEIKELVGIAESRDPTDVDRFHLKTLVRKLKQKNESLAKENQQMGGTIDALKSGRFNESHSAKIMMNQTEALLKDDLEVIKSELETLRKENANLKVRASKGVEMQSAM